MSSSLYKPLVDHYERCLEQYGPTCQGVGWPRLEDVHKRFKSLTGIWAQERTPSDISVLDLGCGYGALIDYINTFPSNLHISYLGIDASPKMIDTAREKYPNMHFEQRDIIASPLSEQCVDYVLINGVLTAKCELTQTEMIIFVQKLLLSAFNSCRKGMAFNIMNYHADWKRDDLFYWPFDEAAAFIRTHCSRHYAFHADSGLYDYMAYVYREPLNG